MVAREWQQEMTGMEAARIKKAYLKLLLALQQFVLQPQLVDIGLPCTCPCIDCFY